MFASKITHLNDYQISLWLSASGSFWIWTASILFS